MTELKRIEARDRWAAARATLVPLGKPMLTAAIRGNPAAIHALRFTSTLGRLAEESDHFQCYACSTPLVRENTRAIIVTSLGDADVFMCSCVCTRCGAGKTDHAILLDWKRDGVKPALARAARDLGVRR
ncbi:MULTISPECIES: hypothetical protein [unclassified Mesorhizobium]|uniref:hypothetical protein n=1 Tax=unclassified Mesorhizobium TaxID=325217 RepID=UPI000F76424D|nr:MULTISPECIES: hypothetical protein [unclassified Mesorhizobium]AZO75356.1 hypothetical protein EJ067_32400 [Mesorhizobium sp. M1D.F.Ca.ET.043.01.1.1]RWA87670.1 MAG: hypothetical protein EOQ32_23990 [Mesorhizobium sp.]